MKKKKSNLPRWKYDFSCKKCRHIQYVKEKESAAGSYAESAMTSEGFEVTDEDIPF